MKVIVGGIIEKNGKYLLVQEAKKKCYKKWNFPAGHLDFNESLEQGAIREIKEETGCDVELNGVCYIANRILENDLFVIAFIVYKITNTTLIATFIVIGSTVLAVVFLTKNRSGFSMLDNIKNIVKYELMQKGYKYERGNYHKE